MLLIKAIYILLSNTHSGNLLALDDALLAGALLGGLKNLPELEVLVGRTGGQRLAVRAQSGMQNSRVVSNNVDNLGARRIRPD